MTKTLLVAGKKISKKYIGRKFEEVRDEVKKLEYGNSMANSIVVPPLDPVKKELDEKLMRYKAGLEGAIYLSVAIVFISLAIALSFVLLVSAVSLLN